MTTMHHGGYIIPEWDVPDRMGKALRTSGMSVRDAADYFEVHRNTISGWLHGRINVDARTLKLWAVMTGVPYQWLKEGTAPDPGGPDGLGGIAGVTPLPTSGGKPDKPTVWLGPPPPAAHILELPAAG